MGGANNSLLVAVALRATGMIETAAIMHPRTECAGYRSRPR